MSGAREQSLPSKRAEHQEEQSETGSQRKASRESSEPGQSDEDEGPDQSPRSELEKFDWDDLESRFQSMVQSRDLEEQKLWEEFTQLVEFFKIWAATPQSHEVDRSMRRLATRMYHVQHSEAQVEQKRQHYIRVVEAFENALKLLRAG